MFWGPGGGQMSLSSQGQVWASLKVPVHGLGPLQTLGDGFGRSGEVLGGWEDLLMWGFSTGVGCLVSLILPMFGDPGAASGSRGPLGQITGCLGTSAAGFGALWWQLSKV